MKLAIDASRANKKQKTGVEWYAFYVIQEIIKNLREHDEVILYFQEQPRKEWGSFPANVQIKVLNWPPKFLWTHLRLGLQTFLDKPDVLFIPAHVIPFLHRGKAVMTLHDVAFHYFRESYSWLQNQYQTFAIWYAKNFAAHIITPTEITQKDLHEIYNIPLDKMTVIRHGVDISAFQELKNIKNFDAGKVVQKYKIKKDNHEIDQVLKKDNMINRYILYVGRIETKKNLQNMLHAFEQFKRENPQKYPDLKFVLVGKPGFGYDEVKHVIDQSQYNNDIIMLGWVEDPDLMQLYKSAECLLYVTLYEGFGMPIYEAFAAQIPVITSHQGAAAEITEDYGLCVNPHDVAQIKQALDDVLIDKKITLQKTTAAFEYVQSQTWKQCGKQTIELLQNM